MTCLGDWMIKLIWNKPFKRKLKNYLGKHPDMEDKIKSKLKVFCDDPYAPELRTHKLSGELKDLHAIVIDYDCRIVFSFVKPDGALLVTIGTHDEVY